MTVKEYLLLVVILSIILTFDTMLFIVAMRLRRLKGWLDEFEKKIDKIRK